MKGGSTDLLTPIRGIDGMGLILQGMVYSFHTTTQGKHPQLIKALLPRHNSSSHHLVFLVFIFILLSKAELLPPLVTTMQVVVHHIILLDTHY